MALRSPFLSPLLSPLQGLQSGVARKLLSLYGTDAAAAYSLYDLGNKRGTVTETEATYHNPVVRLRRDSDNTHRSFSATEIKNGTAETWVNQDVVTYASDFSAGTDGWVPLNGTIASNIDGIGGEDDNLRYTAGSTDTWQLAGKIAVISGLDYEVSLDVYLSSTNSDLNEVHLCNALNASKASTSTTDTWVTLSASFTANNTNIRIQGAKSGDFTFPDAGADDVFYIRNIQITQTTSNAYAAVLYDQSGVEVVSTNYASDFSGGVDGWAGSAGASVAQSSGSDEVGDTTWLKVTSISSGASIFINNAGELDGTNEVYSVTGKLWVDSSFNGSATHIKVYGTGISDSNAGVVPISSALGQAYQFSVLISGDSGTGFSFTTSDANGTNVNGDGDDIYFLKDLVVAKLNKLHNDATQATAASQPKVVSAGSLVTDANGNYALDFDGTDDVLIATASDMSGTDVGISRFAVFDSDESGGSVQTVSGLYNTGNGNVLYHIRPANDKFAYVKRDDAASLQFVNGVVNHGTGVVLWSWLDSGTSGSLYEDGTVTELENENTDVGALTHNVISIGGQYAAGVANNFFYDKIAAVLWYSADKSSTRSELEAALSRVLVTALS